MATGPDHYREAERFAGQADGLFTNYVDAHDEDGSTPDVDLIRRQTEHCREMGKLHATLAVAASTALQAALPLIGDDQQVTEWGRAIGVTFTTPDAVRIDDAHALVDQLGEEGLIVPAAAERLREVLGKRAEALALGRTPAEAIEELSVLIYESGVIDDGLSAAGSAENLAEALLKAGVRLPAETPGGGA